MKKLIRILVVVLMLGLPSMATADDSVLSIIKKCDLYSSLAQTIMIARQADISMDDLLWSIKNSKNRPGEEAIALAVGLIKAAYSTPVYTTPEIKTTAIRSFEAAALDVCLEKSGIIN